MGGWAGAPVETLAEREERGRKQAVRANRLARYRKAMRALRYGKKVRVKTDRLESVVTVGKERYREFGTCCELAEGFVNPFGLVLEWIDDLLTAVEDGFWNDEEEEGGVCISDAAEQRLLQALRDPKRRGAVEAVYRISGPAEAVRQFSRKR
jgi:hypothetical protein